MSETSTHNVTSALSAASVGEQVEANLEYVYGRYAKAILIWSQRALERSQLRQPFIVGGEDVANEAIAKTFERMRQNNVSFANRRAFVAYLKTAIRSVAASYREREQTQKRDGLVHDEQSLQSMQHARSERTLELLKGESVDAEQYASAKEMWNRIWDRLSETDRPLLLGVVTGDSPRELATANGRTEFAMKHMLSSLRAKVASFLKEDFGIEAHSKRGRPAGSPLLLGEHPEASAENMAETEKVSSIDQATSRFAEILLGVLGNEA